MQNINMDITQPAFYSYLQRKPAHLEWSLLFNSLLNLNVQVWYFSQAEEKTLKTKNSKVFFTAYMESLQADPTGLTQLQKQTEKGKGPLCCLIEL